MIDDNLIELIPSSIRMELHRIILQLSNKYRGQRVIAEDVRQEATQEIITRIPILAANQEHWMITVIPPGEDRDFQINFEPDETLMISLINQGAKEVLERGSHEK